ncbi:MAG: YfiR family protein [Chitinivibrionales bacterium]|nr:YfiR family protein [Chitinivibrionales bacterium]
MKRTLLCSLIVFCLGCGVSFGQDAKFSALYIINFAKYVGWPSAGSGDFVITVLGDDPAFTQLQSMSAESKIGDQAIVVNKSMNLDKIEKCNILFISQDKSNVLASAQAKFASSNVLIVTNKDGLGQQGAGINLVTIGGKLTFEINVESLKKCGLTAKPALFKLGKTI